MKTILCFGDSNTWGYIPASEGRRYPHGVRWPGVMQQALGDDYRVIEEALNGRTSVWDDPLRLDRNGRKHLPMVLETHAPIDLVIIALGINDLKHHFQLNANDIAFGMATLVEIVQQSKAGPVIADSVDIAPQVVMVTPVRPVPTTHPFGVKFDGAVERSQGIADAYRGIAEQLHCLFFDSNTIITCPETDGLHLDDTAHKTLGTALAQFVSQHV